MDKTTNEKLATLYDRAMAPVEPSGYLAACPFCGAPGIDAEIVDDGLFPSGRAIMCSGGCWISGSAIDYEAWQRHISQPAKWLAAVAPVVHEMFLAEFTR